LAAALSVTTALVAPLGPDDDIGEPEAMGPCDIMASLGLAATGAVGAVALAPLPHAANTTTAVAVSAMDRNFTWFS
jgi:hypothetical protein